MKPHDQRLNTCCLFPVDNPKHIEPEYVITTLDETETPIFKNSVRPIDDFYSQRLREAANSALKLVYINGRLSLNEYLQNERTAFKDKTE